MSVPGRRGVTLALVPPKCARSVLPALLAAAAVAVGGCYWLRYHDLVLTHAELIEDLSDATLPQLQTAPAGVSPGDVERLRYPLERARQFLEISAKRHPGRESLAELTALVGVYAGFLAQLDRVRGGATDGVLSADAAASAASAIAAVGEIRAHAGRVRDAVARERVQS